MQGSLTTHEQLEQQLSQQIGAFYQAELEHLPSRVACQVLGEKIVIILDNAITQPEQFLASQGKQNLVERVRFNLDKAMRSQIKQLIEEVVGVSVVDLLVESTLQTGRMSTIAILAEAPKLHSPSSNSVQPTETESNGGNDGSGFLNLPE